MAEDTNTNTHSYRGGNVAVVIRRSWLAGRQLQINADGGCALCSRYCIFYDLFCRGTIRGCKCRCCLVIVGDAICPWDMTQENIHIIIYIKVIERVIRRHHTEHDLYASISGEDTRRLWHSEISCNVYSLWSPVADRVQGRMSVCRHGKIRRRQRECVTRGSCDRWQRSRQTAAVS